MRLLSINKKISGATLLETLISVGVFTVLVMSVFTIFNMGKSNWNVTLLRSDLQNEGRKTVLSLERDLRSTNFSSIGVLNDAGYNINAGGLTGIQRHALCMVGIDDWSKTGNFDPVNGLPIWDEHIIYMATTETGQGGYSAVGGMGSGRLVKITIGFSTAACGPVNNCLDPYLSGTTPIPLQFSQYYTPGLADIVTRVTNDALAAKSASSIVTEISGLLPNSPSRNYVKVEFIGSVFAFSVSKCDPYAGCVTSPVPAIGISFQDRKRTNRVGEGTSGIESFQMNLNITPQANHSF